MYIPIYTIYFIRLDLSFTSFYTSSYFIIVYFVERMQLYQYLTT